MRTQKKEGDGATPRGAFGLAKVLFRPDRVRRPKTALPVEPLRVSSGWCDADDDRNYNRTVTLPYPASAERLWRDDPLYDVIVILDYNIWPRSLGRGSAIFLHVARPGFLPTEGCIAMKREHLLRLLRAFDSHAAIVTCKRAIRVARTTRLGHGRFRAFQKRRGTNVTLGASLLR